MIEQVPAFVKQMLFNLAYERGLRNLTREELQRATGVREDILRAYEEGRGRPTKSKYNKLAEFFGWTVWQ